jgi:predicted dehydrogenase
MRVGIIGGGFGLSVQAPIIETYPLMNIVAVSTMHRHELREALKSSIVHYTNWKEMIEQAELDLIFISSIPLHHYEIAKYAVEKGIHIVCEKPFTMNSEQALELCKLAKHYHVKGVIDFEWRYLPIRQKVKEMILHNDIGEINHFEYHVSRAQYENLLGTKRGWMGEKEKFGGMLGAIGTHMVDCLRWLLESEATMVHGLVHTHVKEGAGETRDADDAFFIHGKMDTDATFSIQLVSGIHHGDRSSLRIFGDLGTIVLMNDKQLYFGKGHDALTEIILVDNRKIPIHLSTEAKAYYPAFYPFLENVYEYMVNNTVDRDLPTILDGHANQVIIDKIRERK